VHAGVGGKTVIPTAWLTSPPEAAAMQAHPGLAATNMPLLKETTLLLVVNHPTALVMSLKKLLPARLNVPCAWYSGVASTATAVLLAAAHGAALGVGVGAAVPVGTGLGGGGVPWQTVIASNDTAGGRGADDEPLLLLPQLVRLPVMRAARHTYVNGPRSRKGLSQRIVPFLMTVGRWRVKNTRGLNLRQPTPVTESRPESSGRRSFAGTSPARTYRTFGRLRRSRSHWPGLATRHSDRPEKHPLACLSRG
jgi:hypothetical protein